MTPITYRTIQVDALDVFYREAGPSGGLSRPRLMAFPAQAICSGFPPPPPKLIREFLSK